MLNLPKNSEAARFAIENARVLRYNIVWLSFYNITFNSVFIKGKSVNVIFVLLRHAKSFEWTEMAVAEL